LREEHIGEKIKRFLPSRLSRGHQQCPHLLKNLK
jgi:hypothetical protein